MEYHYVITLQFHTSRGSTQVRTTNGVLVAGKDHTRQNLYDTAFDIALTTFGGLEGAVLYFSLERNKL
ncbi:hypothetical protein [Streptomyces sp. NPDC056169]|uniref:hypothetical protein n=1 Tax=Streptomyces sp. NPDC056169 TaxID=3345734 RepID=UPI0035D78CB6